jgi:hypothetical protein
MKMLVSSSLLTVGALTLAIDLDITLGTRSAGETEPFNHRTHERTTGESILLPDSRQAGTPNSDPQ